MYPKYLLLLSLYFYYLQIAVNTAWRRSQASKSLKQEIGNQSVDEFQRKFLLTLPDITMHSGHSVGEVGEISVENLWNHDALPFFTNINH